MLFQPKFTSKLKSEDGCWILFPPSFSTKLFSLGSLSRLRSMKGSPTSWFTSWTKFCLGRVCRVVFRRMGPGEMNWRPSFQGSRFILGMVMASQGTRGFLKINSHHVKIKTYLFLTIVTVFWSWEAACIWCCPRCRSGLAPDWISWSPPADADWTYQGSNPLGHRNICLQLAAWWIGPLRCSEMWGLRRLQFIKEADCKQWHTIMRR